MANVVVIGAGLGGLPAAYELRHLLPSEHTVTLVSDKPEFTFIPGLIQVAFDLKPLAHVQVSLAKLAQRHHLNWVSGKVTALDPAQQRLTIEGQAAIAYDYLLIATGASLAWDWVPGTGPHGGYTHSVCTPDHALEARQAWLAFLENPGPMVVGAAPGAGCFGPAYEFALIADQALRRRGLRDQVPITYVTPEPYAGHLGVSGVKNARELTADLMQERGIEVIDNATITAVEANAVRLADGRKLPFAYAMILPAFQGAQFIRDVPGLGDDKGFIPILPTQRHPEFANIYAAGVSIKLAQPDQTPVPIGLPKSGQMAEAMGMAVAHNIARELGVIQATPVTPTLAAICMADFGDTGIVFLADPVLPNPKTGQRRRAIAKRGRWVSWLKIAFEQFFLTKMRWGLSVPWFERWSLRLLGLSLVEPIPVSKDYPIESSLQAR